jgi:hypothetical protein
MGGCYGRGAVGLVYLGAMLAPAWFVPARRLIGLLVVLLGVLTSAGAMAGQPPAESAASRAEGERLLAVVAPFGNFVRSDASSDGFTFLLRDERGQGLGELHVGSMGPGRALPRLRSQHYALTIWNTSPDFHASVDVLIPAANAIVAADGGPLPEGPVRLMSTGDIPPMESAVLYVLAAALLMGALRRFRMTLDIRKPHVVQACIHTSIFVYWSFYWPGVADQAPMIALMIAMAYGADATFSFLKFGSWRVGLAPLPIVFSTNLFVWLDWHGAVIAMIGALLFKTFVQRKGRHIFNPSVAGLTLNALCTILFPDFVHFGGLFHTLNIAPNMAEWVFLGSLIPLTMFRLLPVSIGAIIGLHYLAHTPGALRPTLLLMMTLLATDPATTPDTRVGRLMFGLLVGVSYPICSHLLHHLGQPDDFAKILSVPLPNLLTPQLDALARRITPPLERAWKASWAWLARRAGRIRPRVERLGASPMPVPNGLFVVAWVVLFVVPLFGEKPRDFEPALHWNWGTPLVIRDPDDVPRCASNPVFCRPFSFVGEAKSWIAREHPPGDPRP